LPIGVLPPIEARLRINAGMFASASDESNSALASGSAASPNTAIT
jgi:hypothetical protein